MNEQIEILNKFLNENTDLLTPTKYCPTIWDFHAGKVIQRELCCFYFDDDAKACVQFFNIGGHDFVEYRIEDHDKTWKLVEEEEYHGC